MDEGAAFLFGYAFRDVDACLSQLVDTSAGDVGVGVARSYGNAWNAGADEEIGAGRGQAVVVAGLQRDDQRVGAF